MLDETGGLDRFKLLHRLPKGVMFGELVGGAGCVGGPGKRVDGVSPG